VALAFVGRLAVRIAKFLGTTAAVAIMALVNAAPGAQAATITGLFNTGLNASSTLMNNGDTGDAHYSLVSVPGSSTNVTRAITSAQGFPIPPYIADDSLSRWIGPNNANDLASPDGVYDFQITFDLTGLNPSTANILGLWASDDDSIIKLNGAATGNSVGGSSPYAAFKSFSILSGFVAGINTLDFIVTNENCPSCGAAGNPAALRVEFTSGTAVATPLPAALPLFATGLSALGLFGWRSKRKAQAAA
jgi:hypothetical protein